MSLAPRGDSCFVPPSRLALWDRDHVDFQCSDAPAVLALARALREVL